ncbi:MAG TPA: agmatinase [Bauldia sp.]|nr:agmatinase [Bauldia sp.]
MTDARPRPTDNAVFGPLMGGSPDPTYGGVLSFMRRRYSRDLAGVDAVVWGIPFDQAVSNRPGARFGPSAIRRASAIFDGDPQYPFGFDLFETLAVVDYGDASFDFTQPQAFAETIAAQAGEIINGGTQLFSLGGDHFVTYPLLKAHAARHGRLALIQFDAHQDTWPDHGGISHGGFVARAVREGVIDPARSVQVGIRTVAPEDCGIHIIRGHELDTLGISGVTGRVREVVGEMPAYLTFDIDCLDPAFAPGTGTPVSGGLTSREALAILRGLGSVDFVGGDVVEVAPPYDHADITAIAASTVAMYYLGLLAERRRG